MENDITKKLIQKSIVNTSQDFTDKLLHKIESEKATLYFSGVRQTQMFRLSMLGMIGVTITLFALLLLDLLPALNIINMQLKMNSTPLLATGILLLLLGANHILKMQHLVNLQDKTNVE